jgi:hypothetical protein
MGTWGYGIFDDDTASDLRWEFEDAIAEGLDVSGTTQRVLETLGEAVDDFDDGPTIWLSLAELQMGLGSLQPTVRERALELMEQDLERWEESGPDEVAKRKAVLEDLRACIEQAA